MFRLVQMHDGQKCNIMVFICLGVFAAIGITVAIVLLTTLKKAPKRNLIFYP